MSANPLMPVLESLQSRKQRRRGQVRRTMSKWTRVKRLKALDPQRYCPHELRMNILIRDQYRCRYCAAPITNDTANIDHVIPWRDRGPTILSNLVSACRGCNKLKMNRLWLEPIPLPHEIRKTHKRQAHRRSNCQKPDCLGRHLDLRPDVRVDRNYHRLERLGTTCKHRASPYCKRQRCLVERRAVAADYRNAIQHQEGV